jgi:hypothetical protein
MVLYEVKHTPNWKWEASVGWKTNPIRNIKDKANNSRTVETFMPSKRVESMQKGGYVSGINDSNRW